MRNAMRAALVALAISATCAAARADLIVNGSFEAPPVPVGGYTNYPGGSTALTGWTVVGPQVSVVNGTYVSNGIQFQAQDQAQWIDLAGDGANSKDGGITQ